MRTRTTPPLLLLPLVQLATTVPITLHPNDQLYSEVWVTNANTLNATTWSPTGHNSTVISSSSIQTTVNTTNITYNAANLRKKSSTVRDVSVWAINSKIAYESIDVGRPDDCDESAANGMGGDHPTFGEPVANTGGQNATSLEGTPPTSTPTDSGGPSATYSGKTAPSGTTTSTGGQNTAMAGNGTMEFLDDSSDEQALADKWVNAYVAGNSSLSVEIVNRLPSNNVKAWVTGLDPEGALIMLGSDGGWIYPTTSSAVPVPISAGVTLSLAGPNATLPITLPGYIESGRMWFADGNLQFYVVATATGPGLVEPAVANINDPNAAINYGFVELTWGASYGLFADISAVDFIGLPLGIELIDAGNNNYSVLGTPTDAACALCNQLATQSQIDGQPWGELCAKDTNGTIVRVMSPSNYLAYEPQVFGNYFEQYVNDVWSHFTNNDLVVNTQAAAGNVTCRVVGEELTCAGDNRPYAKPSDFDIFGCNTGPFALQTGDNAVHTAIVPRLCAAFNRATFLLDGGNVTPGLPPSRYYEALNQGNNSQPFNHYSALVHKMETDGKGYAFAYDDVTPSPQEDQSGLVASSSPKLLRVIVGGT